MKLLILVNVLESQSAGSTTVRLATEAASRGHQVWLTSPGNFTYDPSDRVVALCREIPAGTQGSVERVARLLRANVRERWVTVDELDAVLLRNNPSVQKPWAQSAATEFGRLATRRGVIVLNDPSGLARAMNKLYLQSFHRSLGVASGSRFLRLAQILRSREGFGSPAKNQGMVPTNVEHDSVRKGRVRPVGDAHQNVSDPRGSSSQILR